VSKAFDGATAKADWGFLDLDEVMTKNVKASDLAKKKVYVKEVDVPLKKSLNPRLKDQVQLHLTREKSFSMYLFDKPNKGFANSQKVNCFMNVILQSLLASPAFFNLLQAINETDDILSNL
jgi:hypothetical protein